MRCEKQFFLRPNETSLEKSLRNSYTIESRVDSNRNISKVDVFIGDKTKYGEINTLFDLLNSKKQTVEHHYSMREIEVIAKYAEISFE